MKKRICAAVALVLAALLSFPTAVFAAEPAVTCESYIIMDASTGQVILEKNADERLYPASITKIMTVGLALEKAGGDLDFSLTVPDEAVYPLVGTGSSHVALQPG